MGNGGGVVFLTWAPVKKATTYYVERATSIEAPDWQTAGSSTKAKLRLNGLVSGTRYWFRVRGIGTRGPGVWSNPISRIAP